MARRYAIDVPLHLAQDDYSKDACDLRYHLYASAFSRTGGAGFMLPRGTGSKRKRPRRGWAPQASRAFTLLVQARYGAASE